MEVLVAALLLDIVEYMAKAGGGGFAGLIAVAGKAVNNPLG